MNAGLNGWHRGYSVLWMANWVFVPRPLDSAQSSLKELARSHICWWQFESGVVATTFKSGYTMKPLAAIVLHNLSICISPHLRANQTLNCLHARVLTTLFLRGEHSCQNTRCSICLQFFACHPLLPRDKNAFIPGQQQQSRAIRPYLHMCVKWAGFCGGCRDQVLSLWHLAALNVEITNGPVNGAVNKIALRDEIWRRVCCRTSTIAVVAVVAETQNHYARDGRVREWV